MTTTLENPPKQSVNDHWGLVISVARKYERLGSSFSIPFEEVISLSRLGLQKAIEGFDPDRELEFSTYATTCIKREIYRGLLKTAAASFDIAAAMLGKVMTFRRIRDKLQSHTGIPPTLEDIAASMMLTPAQTEKISAASDRLKLSISTGYDMNNADDFLPAAERAPANTPRPDEEVMLREEIEKMKGFLPKLPEKQRTVVTLYFGLDGNPPLTHDKIGTLMGFTHQTSSNTLAAALKTLRVQMNSGRSFAYRHHLQKQN